MRFSRSRSRKKEEEKKTRRPNNPTASPAANTPSLALLFTRMRRRHQQRTLDRRRRADARDAGLTPADILPPPAPKKKTPAWHLMPLSLVARLLFLASPFQNKKNLLSPMYLTRSPSTSRKRAFPRGPRSPPRSQAEGRWRCEGAMKGWRCRGGEMGFVFEMMLCVQPLCSSFV